MKTLRECIKEAQEKKVAIGHFNISNLEGLWAIFNAARVLNVPVIIGVSEGERDFIGPAQALALVRSLQKEYDYPIFLNADHTYSFERIKQVVDLGYDAVIYDGAKLSIEENTAMTKQAVDYARSVNPEMLVEAELGYIGQGSVLLDAIPEGVSLANLTTPEEAKHFVTETGIDLFAPSVGNIHGMLRNTPDPRLNVERVREIAQATGKPLVLHGGSGTVDEDFTSVIAAGITIIHINTEIRVAFRDALKKTLAEKPDETTPYKLTKPSLLAMQEVITKRLKLFNNMV